MGFGYVFSLVFICPYSKNTGRVMGKPAAGGRAAPERRPISNSNNFYPIFTKLSESVYGHKISVKFDNQLYHPRHLRVMAL